MLNCHELLRSPKCSIQRNRMPKVGRSAERAGMNPPPDSMSSIDNTFDDNGQVAQKCTWVSRPSTLLRRTRYRYMLPETNDASSNPNNNCARSLYRLRLRISRRSYCSGLQHGRDFGSRASNWRDLFDEWGETTGASGNSHIQTC